MSAKKVLIVTYYWPPAGGPGVQRWLKFVKYLPEFNIEPIVFCPESPYYPIIDSSLEGDIPRGVKIIKHPINEPYRWATLFSRHSTKTISSGVIPKTGKQSLIQKILLFIRGNFFIPDARKHWVKPSVSVLNTILENEGIDTIITTGPPHSMHLIGLYLKQKSAITWFADFRDPWTTIGYHKDLRLTKASRAKHENMEARVLNTADHIIVTSNNTKAEFSIKTKTPISVITNGFDYYNASDSKKDELFSIAHIGSLLSERNPKLLWECLQELITENIEFNQLLQLNLIGIVSDSVIQSIEAHGLKHKTNLVGYVSHDEANTYQQKSQLLLLIEIDSEETKAIIPGKLFEYLRSETPILAVGPKDSDVETIVKETSTGTYFNYNQKLELKQQILKYFEAFKQDSLKVFPVGINKYSRKTLTKQLSEIILE